MDYEDMIDFQNALLEADGDLTNTDPWERFYNTLVNNAARVAGTMRIVATPENGSWNVKIYTNGNLSYDGSDLSLGQVEKLTFQSHWGSGVIFSNVDIRSL